MVGAEAVVVRNNETTVRGPLKERKTHEEHLIRGLSYTVFAVKYKGDPVYRQPEEQTNEISNTMKVRLLVIMSRYISFRSFKRHPFTRMVTVCKCEGPGDDRLNLNRQHYNVFVSQNGNYYSKYNMVDFQKSMETK